MAYFPAFLNMNTSRVLVVGGGNIAQDKIEKLLDFTQNITIIALEVNEKVSSLVCTYNLTLHQRAYISNDMHNFDIIIVATNTLALQKKIYQDTRMTRILVNAVDTSEYCDFIFPSYLQKGDLTVAFSTGGSSPAFAKKMRQYFEHTIPDSVEYFLQTMKRKRQEIPKGKARMQYFEKMVDRFFSNSFK